jgi:hypothetical protein
MKKNDRVYFDQNINNVLLTFFIKEGLVNKYSYLKIILFIVFIYCQYLI